MEPRWLDADTRRLQQPDCSSIHPFTHPQHHTFQPTQRVKAQTLSQKASVPYRARRISAGVTLRRPLWPKRTTGRGASSSRRTRSSSKTVSSSDSSSSQPSMVPPRGGASQILLQVPVRSPRVCAAGTRLEKSGCQAPPRKQEARGVGGVDVSPGT